MGDVCMDCEGMGCGACSLTGHRNPVTERDARIAALEAERDALRATVERVEEAADAMRMEQPSTGAAEQAYDDCEAMLRAALAEPTGGE